MNFRSHIFGAGKHLSTTKHSYCPNTQVTLKAARAAGFDGYIQSLGYDVGRSSASAPRLLNIRPPRDPSWGDGGMPPDAREK